MRPRKCGIMLRDRGRLKQCGKVYTKYTLVEGNFCARRFGRKKDKSKDEKNDPRSEDAVVTSDAAAELNGDIHPSGSRKSLDGSINDGTEIDSETVSDIPPAASSDESAAEETCEPEAEKPDLTIPIEDLKELYTTKHADEDRLFREEMKDLTAYVSRRPPSSEYAKLPQNREKNRYKNIVTSDKARVVLQRIDDDPFSDYINASYIDGYSKKRKFIATQGPKPATVNDFWRMVWEEKVEVIVMVTDFRENGKMKCEHYFPENGGDQYGKIFVHCKITSSYGDYTLRSLEIRYEEEEVFDNDETDEGDGKEVRTIVHLQCKKWPDHGVPKTTSSIYRLYQKMLDSCSKDTDSPILIHCSAGVGRTGTLIGLDILIEQLKAEQKVNVYDTVIDMRQQRTDMVQGLDQYVLLHKLLLEYHYFNPTDYTVAEFEERMKESEKEGETDKRVFAEEFELLSLVPPQNSRFGSGSLPQNAEKNRDPKVIPYEHSQIFVRMRPAEMRPPYANASPLSTYDGSFEMIATQNPYSNSEEDFWRAILDNNVTCIVMLTPLLVDDMEYCPQYWPSEDSKEIGDITIQFEQILDHTSYTETKLCVTATDRGKVTKPVTHIQYGSWLDDGPIPENCDSVLLEMIAHVDRHVQQELQSAPANGPKTRVLVHCRDGSGITGVFCAVINLIQRLKSENKIDVFRTVKDLRDLRPLMVRTTSQYEFCHRTIVTYLRSFDLYTNGT